MPQQSLSDFVSAMEAVGMLATRRTKHPSLDNYMSFGCALP
jgi:hypothetical protein